jgi:iron complex outermembrane receptor protein
MKRTTCGAISIALGATLATPAFAQSTASAATATSETGEIEEVLVTGSRLASGFDTPTPVAMFQAEALAATAPNNMGEALGQLPSLAGSVQNTTSGQGSGNSGTNGQNLLNLRQLGPNRTLILLDGQRMGVTNVVSSVDINIIPQNLVKRVDIVTGGASASYGSDAVAGVVNFILDTTFEGFKVDFNGGITDRSDAENGKVSMAFGKALGDRGRVVAGAEYFKMDGLKYGVETGRDWFDRPIGAWPNPVANTAPTIVLVPNAKSEFGSYGGTITAVGGCATGAAGDACRAGTASLVNQRFLPGGALTPFVFGSNHAGFGGGGDGAIVNQPFTPDSERKSFFAHGEFDLNERMTLWAQGSFNKSETFLQAQVASQLATTQFAIQEDNAFLPAAVKSVLNGVAGNQTLSLTRYDLDMGFQEVTGDTQVKRYSMGLKGRFTDTWSYDTTVGYQDSHQQLYIRNTIMRNLYAAADAVVNPANGQVVCRSTIYATPTSTTPVAGGTGMDPGCVPLNLFGEGAPSQAATDFAWGLNTADVFLRQTTADANLRGDFGDRVSLGAGAISFAAGLNYRRVTADREVDPLSAIYIDGTGVRGFPSGLQGRYGGYQYYNPAPLSGVVKVSEGYLEFGVPLLKDLPLVQSLDTTIAGRLTDYSQSGVEEMWKLGLNWTLNESLRFRSTLSADTRAPSVLELFNTGSVTQGRNTVPYSTSTSGIRSSGQNITKGNVDLKPEHARTYTAGFVMSPSFAPGLQGSIDWYKIDIDGAIAAPGNQQIVDGCYFGNQEYCGLITVNGQAITTTTGITAADFVVVTNPTLNQGIKATSGIDFEVAYKKPMGAGELALRMNGNYLLTLDDAVIGCPVGSAGTNPSPVGAIGSDCGLNPKIRARVSANYDVGRFGLYVQERYVHKGKIDPNYVAGVDITFNNVPAIWYTDLTAKFNLGTWFGGESEVYGNVTNLFDKDPPVTTSSSRSWVEPSELDLYDALGRRYVLGLRMKF